LVVFFISFVIVDSIAPFVVIIILGGLLFGGWLLLGGELAGLCLDNTLKTALVFSQKVLPPGQNGIQVNFPEGGGRLIQELGELSFLGVPFSQEFLHLRSVRFTVSPQQGWQISETN